MSKLVLVSGDLMATARVEGAARKLGLQLTAAPAREAALAAAADDCPVVLLDLRSGGFELAEFVSELRRQQAPPAIVAFGPHVQETRLAEARAAGCDLVITRGQLDREIETILARFCESR